MRKSRTARKQIIIADDITGAGDSGIHFAVAGRKIALLLHSAALVETLAHHEMISLSSESRFLEPGEAAQAVRRTVRACRAAGAEIVYKKVDSTLRGNPGAEIEALLDEGEFDIALVCPAMPKTGRAIRGGRLFLHGESVNNTEMGNDPFNPVPNPDIAGILAGQTAVPVATISLAYVRAGEEELAQCICSMIAHGARILVADAESGYDLATIAAAIRLLRSASGVIGAKRILPVGAGGFAEAIAGPAKPGCGSVPHGRMLAVVGSLTKTSLEQTDYALAHGGFRLLDMDISAWHNNPEAERRRLTALACIDTSPLLLKNTVLPTGRIDVEVGIRAAAIFAEAARAISIAAGCEILYVTGGSTATAVLQKLGVHAVTLERECMPGVVISAFAPAGTKLRYFISKAGGFGGPETIARLAEATRA